MDKNTRSSLLTVTVGVLLFSALNNLDAVAGVALKLFEVIFPVLLGLAFAFLFNIPMSSIERLLFKLTGGRGGRAVSVISLLLCVACFVSVIIFAGILIVPAVCTSFFGAYDNMSEKLGEWAGMLSAQGIDGEWLYGIVSRVDKNKLISYIAGGAGSVFGSVWDFVLGAVSGAADIGAALVICVYVLLSKRKLGRQISALLKATIGRKRTDNLIHVGRVFSDVYSRFFSRQCTEACILSALMYIALLIFKVPYSALIALLCGICSFVQYLGGVFACVTGVFLVALSEPSKAGVYLIVYAVVQFAENQLIYPNVVGSSVGLGGTWSVCAAVIGGGAFGVVGMILAIPLSAVAATLIKEKIKAKEQPARVGLYQKNKKS